MTGEPLTFGCDRNFTAFWTCSSRNGSEFTKTDVDEMGLTDSSPAFCWSMFDGWIISAPKSQKRESANQCYYNQNNISGNLSVTFC